MIKVRTIRTIVFFAMLAGIGLLVGDSVNAAPAVTVFTAGNMDNFDTSDGPELTSPSANFLGWLSSIGAILKDFDDSRIDRFIAHTFTDLPACIVGATLEVHLRPGNSFLSHNDGIQLTFIGDDQIRPAVGSELWGRRIGSGHSTPGVLPFDWHFGADETIVLDLSNLPLAVNQPSSAGNLIPALNQHGFLDFFVQDDTEIDYLILTVTSCPKCDFIIDADGTTTPDDGIPGAVNVLDGVPLTDFTPTTNYFLSEIRMFDNDSSGSWTEGDDLFAEPTGPHEGANVAKVILDKDGIQQVNFFLHVSGDFLGIRYYDANNNLGWDNGEDIVLDVNGNHIFDLFCVDPVGDLQDLAGLTSSFNPGDFSNPNHQTTLINKINAILNDLDLNDVDSICEAIDKLTNDILPKTDGVIPPPDWVTDPTAQQQLEDAINDIIATLQGLADSLGGC